MIVDQEVTVQPSANDEYPFWTQFILCPPLKVSNIQDPESVRHEFDLPPTNSCTRRILAYQDRKVIPKACVAAPATSPRSACHDG